MMRSGVVVAQKGAREHFLVARALHRQGLFSQLLVDWYSPLRAEANRWLRDVRIGPLARAFGAYSESLPREAVRSLGIRGLARRALLSARTTMLRDSGAVLRDDAAFATRVARMLPSDSRAVFCYSYAALEILRAAKRRGALAVLGQIDPGPREYSIIAEELRRWPEYGRGVLMPPDEYFDRVRSEWEIADLIIVNSEWSREQIISEGARRERIEVIPLAFELEDPASPRRLSQASGAPVRVLWVGRVTVQKGIQYLVEAARLLQGHGVELVVAGKLEVSQRALIEWPRNVRWLGKVHARELADLYSTCDVFVLPTLSDGFALTQLEALAYGLPVIVTENCGRVVENGVTGFVIPARDPAAIASAVVRFVDDRTLAASMSAACTEAARRYSVDAFAERLAGVLRSRLGE